MIKFNNGYYRLLKVSTTDDIFNMFIKIKLLLFLFHLMININKFFTS